MMKNQTLQNQQFLSKRDAKSSLIVIALISACLAPMFVDWANSITESLANVPVLLDPDSFSVNQSPSTVLAFVQAAIHWSMAFLMGVLITSPFIYACLLAMGRFKEQTDGGTN